MQLVVEISVGIPYTVSMFLATVLLEPHRWKPTEAPVFSWQVDSGKQFLEAGFSGVELWQRHWLEASAQQRDWMQTSPCPVRVFSAYGSPADPAIQELLFSVVDAFGDSLRGIKFNVGPDFSHQSTDMQAVQSLAQDLPGTARLLCECHGGTWLETPEAAGEAFPQWPDRVAAILHPFTTENLAAWGQAIGPRIRHLHLQARAQGTWLDPVPSTPGAAEALDFLREIGFCGTASLEFIAAIRHLQDPAALLEEAQKVAESWRTADAGGLFFAEEC